eukprot:364894-Chlamydomonas_euryale.AAC.3
MADCMGSYRKLQWGAASIAPPRTIPSLVPAWWQGPTYHQHAGQWYGKTSFHTTVPPLGR